MIINDNFDHLKERKKKENKNIHNYNYNKMNIIIITIIVKQNGRNSKTITIRFTNNVNSQIA